MPFGKAHWPCLMPLNTGEVHARGIGKPGSGQKVFCPGAQTEQSKHEGIIWSVHGKCWSATLERGKERKVNGGRKNTRRTFLWLWFVKVEAGQGVCQARLYLYSTSVCVCEREIVFGGTNGEGALRQVSSLLTQTWSLALEKSPCRGLYFRNDTPLVRLSRVYDLYK